MDFAFFRASTPDYGVTNERPREVTSYDEYRSHLIISDATTDHEWVFL